MFELKLRELFGEVEAGFRAREVEAYRAMAAKQLASWSARLASEPATPKGCGHYYYRLNEPGKYVHLDVPAGDHDPARYLPNDRGGWGWKRRALAAGWYAADLDRATRDANAAVDDARAQFVAKQTRKLVRACGGRTDCSLGGRLDLGVLVVGHLKATFPNGDGFTLDMSIIVNHRFSPAFVAFYQFPARFRDVRLGGRLLARASEEWMAANFARG